MDPEFCHFRPNPWTAPGWIGLPHPAHQLDQVTVDHCPTGVTSRFPPPEEPESDLMPANHRLRLDDHQRFRPPLPYRAESRPEKPVENAESRGLDRAVQHQQLVPQGEVLNDGVTTGAKSCGQASQDRVNE
jgi:hypothetical protein